MPYEPIDIGLSPGSRTPPDMREPELFNQPWVPPQFRFGNNLVSLNPWDDWAAMFPNYADSMPVRLQAALRASQNNPLMRAAMNPASAMVTAGFLGPEEAQFQNLLMQALQHFFPQEYGGSSMQIPLRPPENAPPDSRTPTPGPPIIEDPANIPPDSASRPEDDGVQDAQPQEPPFPQEIDPAAPEASAGLDGWQVGAIRYDNKNRPWFVGYDANGGLRWKRAHQATDPGNQNQTAPPGGWRADQMTPGAQQQFIWSFPDLAQWMQEFTPPTLNPPSMPPRDIPPIGGAPNMTSLTGSPENYETSGLTPAPNMNLSMPKIPGGGLPSLPQATPKFGARTTPPTGYTAPEAPTAPQMPRRKPAPQFGAPNMRAPRMY